VSPILLDARWPRQSAMVSCARVSIGPPQAGCFGRIDRSGSPRLTQVSFNRHFALATPCAHVPGCSAEPSHFQIGMAHPWSWAIGSSTSAAQRSFDYGRLPSESSAFRVEREMGASGKRPTLPEGNGAVARALFGGLRSHGQRVSAKERAMGNQPSNSDSPSA